MSATNAPEIVFPHLGIAIERLSRVAFSIGGFQVYWYGIFIGLGVVLGLLMASREAKKMDISPEILYDFLFFAIIFSIVGARTYYVVFSWDGYKNDLLSIFNLRNGGIAIYGAIIGATITAIVFTKVKRISFLRFGDICVFGLVIGQIIGRLGNFFNREAFGGYTDSLFAMQYLINGEYLFPKDLVDRAVTNFGAMYIQVHPTFLYEILWNIALFIFMNFYKKYKKFDGEMIAIYFIGYGVGRFWIEGLRTDQLKLFGTGLASSQVLSIILILVCAVFMFFMRKQVRYKQ